MKLTVAFGVRSLSAGRYAACQFGRVAVPLNDRQVAELGVAIDAYCFPAVYFDFVAEVEVLGSDTGAVEAAIHAMLASPSTEDVRRGLANVIYWGYAQISYRPVRVRRFLERVTLDHLTQFQALVAAHGVPTLSQVKAVKIPEYSGISFISKILMFLNPGQYCVLDKQLAKLAGVPGTRALHGLSVGTQIPVTANNEVIYDAWRAECHAISTQYFGGRRRVVDVERGFFQLVQADQLPLAQQIYAAA